jgi:hypothetical protein
MLRSLFSWWILKRGSVRRTLENEHVEENNAEESDILENDAQEVM